MHPSQPSGYPHQQPLVRALPPLQHVWTAQPGDTAQLARAATLNALTNRSTIRTYITIIAIAVMLAVFTPHDRATTYTVVFLVLLLVVLPFSTYQRIRRSLDSITAPGAVWGLGFDAYSIAVVTPMSTAVVGYEAFRQPHRGRGVVTLAYQTSAMGIVMPEVLCPPPAFDHLTSRIPRS
ncbi:hypothetical protein [Williamsia sp. CHRR-6]|uniref:hypothetical protein n=1 Tax=Williamsia sp. CHRR-6 TaxID=2835871 RepID=UPI001BD9BADB|nr:hypothetical protein [Williamsia sp. CHRR-6]MBT0567682.1 hypothetical protein [Williamsia sp. CHRR-6]